MAGIVVAAVREVAGPCRKLAERGVPMVVVHRRLADLEVDTVLVDNVGPTRALVGCLVDDGHRRIGAVIGDAPVTAGPERREGYLQALPERGLPLAPELLRVGPTDKANREATGYELARDLLDVPDPPTAPFTGTDHLTFGALRLIHDRGLRIPDDVALVAFDEVAWMSVVSPPPTVAAQPTHDLGRIAAGRRGGSCSGRRRSSGSPALITWARMPFSPCPNPFRCWARDGGPSPRSAPCRVVPAVRAAGRAYDDSVVVVAWNPSGATSSPAVATGSLRRSPAGSSHSSRNHSDCQGMATRLSWPRKLTR